MRAQSGVNFDWSGFIRPPKTTPHLVHLTDLEKEPNVQLECDAHAMQIVFNRPWLE